MSRLHNRNIGAMVVLVLAAGAAHAGPGDRTEPWDARPFTAPAKDLLAAARDVKAEAGTPAVVLLKEMRISYDERGRSVVRFRRVSAILDQRGVDIEGSVEAGWAPWYQQKPEIRARVLTRDGVFHDLDPATASVSAPPASPHMYNDYKVLRAPLPAVAPGAVVEVEIVKKDHAPFFGRGDAHRAYIGDGLPVQRIRVIIDEPRGLRLRHIRKNLPELDARRERTRAGERWTYTFGPTKRLERSEPNLPGDVAPYPYLTVAPRSSWADLAARYQAVVDERIASGDVAAIDLPRARSADPAVVARDTLAFLHSHVRYTGLEFGASSIVPWTPAETWTRKYGDCKDQATLLVALLRRQGVTAHVALLRAGDGEDVNPSLPTMSRFNHAIVYVPGKRPMWIDPTDEYARAGELPGPDQGRLALIADKGTRKLLRTPVTAFEDNRVIETREIFLADAGGARVVETTTPTGAFERNYRSRARDARPDDLREKYAAYMKNTYGTTELSGYKAADAGDVSAPFSLRIDARDAQNYRTELERIELFLPASALFTYVPEELAREPEAGKDEPREHDFLLAPLHTYELRYRIHVPAGFQVAAMPGNRTTALGAGAYSQSFTRRGDRVEATLRFHTGAAHRLTPAELTAMRAALHALYKRDAPTLVLEHAGMAHLAAGRTVQALAELRALADRHPTRAVHRVRLAHALLRVGMAEVAKAEARRAVAVEPKLALAHKSLGWILQHDALGRRFGEGYDRAGSVAAYRKAKALDPADLEARGDLAIVLEHDADGLRYTDEADMDQAIAEYQALRRDTDSKGMDDNLLIALFLAGQYTEAERFGRSLETSRLRAGVIIASVAAAQGVERALAEARSLVPEPEERRAVLHQAGDRLRGRRMYENAVALATEAARGAGNASALQMSIATMRRFRRHEEAVLSQRDPRSVAQRLLRVLFSPRRVDVKEWRALLARGARDYLDLDELITDHEAGPAMVQATYKENAAMHLESLRDVVLGMYEVEIAERTPWGVRLRGKSRVPSASDLDDVFAVRQGKGYRLLGTASHPVPLAAYALSLADKGKLEPARQWLDWARGDNAALNAQAQADPFWDTPFAMLWHQDGPRDRERIRIAAASVLADHERGARRALPILERCSDDADAAVALQCRRSMLDALDALNRPEQALALASTLALGHPSNPVVFTWQARALARLKRWPQLEMLANRHVTADPTRTWAWGMLLMALLERGDVAAAWRAFERIPAPVRDELEQSSNNLAWASLRDRTRHDAARDLAERVVQKRDRKEPHTLNTLAALHAARGDLQRAHQVLLEAMDARQAIAAQDQDWLVYGRIAQGYGLDDIARAAYGRIKPPESGSAISNYDMARAWLAELGE